jgi:hypothetical protein
MSAMSGGWPPATAVGSVVDPETCLGVEEVQRARVDDHLDVVAGLDFRAGAEAADDRRDRLDALVH